VQLGLDDALAEVDRHVLRTGGWDTGRGRVARVLQVGVSAGVGAHPGARRGGGRRLLRGGQAVPVSGGAHTREHQQDRQADADLRLSLPLDPLLLGTSGHLSLKFGPGELALTVLAGSHGFPFTSRTTPETRQSVRALAENRRAWGRTVTHDGLTVILSAHAKRKPYGD